MPILTQSTVGTPNTGNAVVGDVLAGKTFSSAALTNATGTLDTTVNLSLSAPAGLVTLSSTVGTLTISNFTQVGSLDCNGKITTGVVLDFDGAADGTIQLDNFTGTLATTGAFTNMGVILSNALVGTTLTLAAEIRSLTLSGSSDTVHLVFGSAPTTIILAALSLSAVTDIAITGNLPATSTVAYTLTGQPIASTFMDWLTAQTANIVGGTADLGTTPYDTSQLVAVTVNIGGALYEVGDYLSVNGGSGGAVEVTSVDELGAVTGLIVHAAGTGYTTGSAIGTGGGTGSACTVDIGTVGNAQIAAFVAATTCSVTFISA